MVERTSGTGRPWWVPSIVGLGALLGGAGAIIALVRPAMLVGPGVAIGSAAHIFAGYFAARNLALAGLLLVLLVLKARRALGQVLALFGLIQMLDAFMDCVEGRWPIVPGIVVLGVLFLVAAARLCGSPFWRLRAWAD